MSKYYTKPLAPWQALEVIGLWLAQPRTIVLAPGPQHFAILQNLIVAAGTAGNLTTNAHLAAIAIEHDAELWSFDRDFARFAKLRFRHLLYTSSSRNR